MKKNRIGEAEFESMFREYYPELVRYCIKIVGHPHIAEEIVSDRFIKLWEERENSVVIYSPKNYLIRSVKNAAVNYLKSQYSRLTEFNPGNEEPGLEISEDHGEGFTDDLVSEVNRLMNLMPEKTSMVFSLSRFGELTYREIADQLGIGTKAVEYHINSALKFLKKGLKDFL